jgi:hypothetical protein
MCAGNELSSAGNSELGSSPLDARGCLQNTQPCVEPEDSLECSQEHSIDPYTEPERKRPLGRPKRRWLDNIRMDLVEVGWDDVDWIGLAQDRDRWRVLVNSVSNLRVP